MSARSSLALNQILQQLDSRNVESSVEDSNLIPIIGEVVVKENEIFTYINQKDYGRYFPREVNIEGLIKKNNPLLFNVKLPELVRKFKSFRLPFYVKDNYTIILNEHSYIEGVWHISSGTDFNEHMTILQNEIPEIFRQADSTLELEFKGKKIYKVDFRYYFMDVVSYPSVTETVKIHNKVEFEKMIVLAEKLEYGNITVLEKDEKGKIIRWVVDKKFRF